MKVTVQIHHPRFGKLNLLFAAGGTVTAGNSSQTSGCAAFVIVMSERM